MKTTETLGIVIMTLGILFILSGVIFLIHQVIENPNPKTLVKEVSCYDRYHNEIQGLTCEKEYQEFDEDAYWAIGGFLLGFFFMVFGAGVYNTEEPRQ